MSHATGSVQTVRTSRTPPIRSARATSTDGRILYAIGDVHGCYDQFVALMETIAADIAASADALPALLIFCGDYVDRGPRSSDVLAALVWLSRHAPVEMVMLRGNHEEMLLAFLENPEDHLTWLQQEGRLTLGSYGVTLPDDPVAFEEADCRRLRDELSDRMPASHLDLLRRFVVRKMYGDYIFVHAGLRPNVAISKQVDEDCLWIRDEFLTADHRFDKVVVHGHSWNSGVPVVTPNRIGIDTGVYDTGVLTAVRLEGPNIEFLQASAVEAAIATQATASFGHGPGGL